MALHRPESSSGFISLWMVMPAKTLFTEHKIFMPMINVSSTSSLMWNILYDLYDYGCTGCLHYNKEYTTKYGIKSFKYQGLKILNDLKKINIYQNNASKFKFWK